MFSPLLRHVSYANKTFLTSFKQVTRTFKFAVGDILCPNQMCGLYYLKDSRLNKGLAFTLTERQQLSIQGLQPPRTRVIEEQVKLNYHTLNKFKDPLDKFMYLSDLHERNVKLYFRLVNTYIEEIMPIVYTPTVGYICQRFGSLYRNPTGLYITYYDRCNIDHILRNWPETQIRAICMTDGERVLGLGDLGCNGMNIAIGKLILYTALAGVQPHMLLPVMLDVGTNNEQLLRDPFYLGLRMKRITGETYDEFLDEVLAAFVKRFGSSTIIHFEDFKSDNALRFLANYQCKYCTFNDDIQGTGAVAVAGVYSAALALNKKISDFSFLFAGGGSAVMGITAILVSALQEEGLSVEEAKSKIFITDLDGLMTKDRNLGPYFQSFGKDLPATKGLLDIVKLVKPSVLVGATATPGLFTNEILQVMAQINERPIIFALSNPTSRAECTPEQVYPNTEGRALFCSGSPMPPVEYNGKNYETSQMNNAFIFPGLALGVLASKAYHIPDEMFIIAAKELIKNVSKEKRDAGILFPKFIELNEISIKMAIKVAKYAMENNLAGVYPVPEDLESFIREQVYTFEYPSVIPHVWSWPDQEQVEMTAQNIETLTY